MDYHHEIIESTALRFPRISWSQLNCSIDEPIIFDVSLARRPGDPNSTEAWGFKAYFETYLQGTVRDRTDGTRARFGNIVDFRNYSGKYHAMIGISCDSYNFLKWMRKPTNYCVLHGISQPLTAEMRARCCWLNPQFPECFYIPSVYPQFEQTSPSPTINICVTGGGKSRNHGLLSEALASLKPTDVRLHLFLRGRAKIYPEYHQRNLTHLISGVREKGFEAYQRAISRCHVGLPLIDPVRNPGYFSNSFKKLSGSLPQIIAYKLLSVMHIKLERIYHGHLTAPVEVYNNTEEFIQALNRTLANIRQTRISHGTKE